MGAAGAFAGGTLSFIGQRQADSDQAALERQNASYYNDQAAFDVKAAEREKQVYTRQSDILFGDQVSAFARGGVDVSSGSSLAVLAQTKLQQVQELGAIQTESDLKVKLAKMRAQQSQNYADSLSSPEHAMLEFGTTFMGAGAQAASRAPRSPGD